MRIAINTLAVTAERGGILTYLVDLLDSLTSLEGDHELTLITAPLNQELFRRFEASPRVSFRSVGLTRDSRLRRIWIEQTAFPRILSECGADVLLSPVNVACFSAPCPQVVVVHEAMWSLIPDQLPRFKRMWLSWAVPKSLRVATRVVTVSGAVRDHLVGLGLVEAGRADVVWNGVRRAGLFELPPPAEVLDRIGGGYYLFVGDLYPYKGVTRILDAMDLLRRNLGLDRDLVVVGRDIWGRGNEIAERARELGLDRRVHFLGPVEHGALGWLYERAFCLVLPADVEGFGLPPIEAMACGTPVVVSNRPALPEVVGDAAIQVDVRKPGELVWALRRFEEPSVRAAYVHRGNERAARFDWDTAAAGTLAACRSAAGLAPLETPARRLRERATTPR